MAKEIVQAVRQAEINAADMEKGALLQKEAILSEAMREADTIIATKTKQAQSEAEHSLVLIKQQGDKLLEEATKRAEREVSLMREMAKNKEEAAINLVLSIVI